jgi:hypothetical protein
MVHSYDPASTEEFRKEVDRFIGNAEARLTASLGELGLGEEAKATAFSSSRLGETIHVWWPQRVQSGDVLAELIGSLIAKIPTTIVHQGTSGWSEPEWTRDQRLRLFGIASALSGPPESFSYSSSPVDIMRVAVWLNSCSIALSKPGGVRDAVAAVLPTEVGGAKSASKYILKTLQGLKAGQTDAGVISAIGTLDSLLKLWMKNQGNTALALVRKNKIAWGTVLNAGAPTTKKKVKGNEVTQISTPFKPSRSPWLSEGERKAVAKIYEPMWSGLEESRKSWNAMTSQSQHENFYKVQKAITLHFENLKATSTHVHAVLGRRKKWIYDAVRSAGKVPKSKKDKANPFSWSSAFFKLNLTSTGLAVALVFSPWQWLPSSHEPDKIIHDIWSATTDVNDFKISTSHLSGHCDDCRKLWTLWIEYFEPRARVGLQQVPDPLSIPSSNKFASLPVESHHDDAESDEEEG